MISLAYFSIFLYQSFEKLMWGFFSHPTPFFGLFYQTSNWHKLTTRGRSDIPGTVLESWRSILFENEICINKITIFTPFRNQNGIIQKMSHFGTQTWGTPFGFQKGPNLLFDIRNGKYRPSAFQIRSQNYFLASRSIFRRIWSLVKNAQNHQKCGFYVKMVKIYIFQNTLKIDLRVVAQFWDRI